MKKRIISFVIVLNMILAMLPVTAFATQKYDLWIGGTQVTSDNAGDVLGDGTVAYDNRTSTLTLKGAEITKGYDAGESICGIYAKGDLDIVLKDISRIYLTEEDINQDGIRVEGDLRFTGNGKVYVRATGDYAKGIWVGEELTVKYGPTVSAAGKGGETAFDSCAVWAEGGIELDKNISEEIFYARATDIYLEEEKTYVYVFSTDGKTPAANVVLNPATEYDTSDLQANEKTTMHRIIGIGTENGKIKANAMGFVGQEARVELIPNVGYVAKELYITDGMMKPVQFKDRGNGVYSFTMPDSNVQIKASFVKAESDKVALPYTDVNENEWYGKAIRYAYENGLVEGAVTGDKFEPAENASRAMIIYMLWKAEGMPLSADAGFGDVKVGDYFKAAVDWAKASGISVGYGSTFGAYDNVTREQMVTILYRYAIYKGMDVSVGEETNILSYNDAFDISEYAIPAMQWACGSGIISGDGANLFPQGNTTKAQLAQVIMMIAEKI